MFFAQENYCLKNEFDEWCRSRDLNPDGRNPLPPQDSVSTNSTTSALNAIFTCSPAPREVVPVALPNQGLPVRASAE